MDRVAANKQPRKPKNRWKDRMKKKKSGRSTSEVGAERKEDNDGFEVAVMEGKEDTKVESENCDRENVDNNEESAKPEAKGTTNRNEEDTKSQEPPPKVQKIVDPTMPSFRATCYR